MIDSVLEPLCFSDVEMQGQNVEDTATTVIDASQMMLPNNSGIYVLKHISPSLYFTAIVSLTACTFSMSTFVSDVENQYFILLDVEPVSLPIQ